MAGLKNAASASTLFTKARRKILAVGSNYEGGNTTGGAKTPKKSPSKVTKTTPKSTPTKKKGIAASIARASAPEPEDLAVLTGANLSAIKKERVEKFLSDDETVP